MEKIEWDEKFGTNIPEIDEQHKKLFNIYNKLFNAYNTDNEGVVVYDIFIELLEYTRYHFRKEEEIMKMREYPDIAEHIHLHRKLILDIYKLYEDIENKNINISSSVLEFIRSWLLNHILKEDMKITR